MNYPYALIDFLATSCVSPVENPKRLNASHYLISHEHS